MKPIVMFRRYGILLYFTLKVKPVIRIHTVCTEFGSGDPKPKLINFSYIPKRFSSSMRILLG